MPAMFSYPRTHFDALAEDYERLAAEARAMSARRSVPRPRYQPTQYYEDAYEYEPEYAYDAYHAPRPMRGFAPRPAPRAAPRRVPRPAPFAPIPNRRWSSYPVQPEPYYPEEEVYEEDYPEYYAPQPPQPRFRRQQPQLFYDDEEEEQEEEFEFAPVVVPRRRAVPVPAPARRAIEPAPRRVRASPRAQPLAITFQAPERPTISAEQQARNAREAAIRAGLERRKALALQQRKEEEAQRQQQEQQQRQSEIPDLEAIKEIFSLMGLDVQVEHPEQPQSTPAEQVREARAAAHAQAVNADRAKQERRAAINAARKAQLVAQQQQEAQAQAQAQQQQAQQPTVRFVIKPEVAPQSPAPEPSKQVNAPPTYTYAAPAAKQLLKKPVAAPAQTPKQQAEASRRQSASVEAQQIMQAMRNSLDPAHNVQPTATSSTSTSTSAPASKTTPASPKPKAVSEEELDPTVRVPVRSPSPQMASIESIEEKFVNTSYTFTPPTHLDFVSSISPELAYTPANVPIRQYENTLTSLLTQLDAVESSGSEEVRFARKELVGRIEGDLEKLDELKLSLFRKQYPDAVLPEKEVEVEEEAEEGYDFVPPVEPEVAPEVVEAEAPVETEVASEPAASAPIEPELESESLPEPSTPIAPEPTEPKVPEEAAVPEEEPTRSPLPPVVEEPTPTVEEDEDDATVRAPDSLAQSELSTPTPEPTPESPIPTSAPECPTEDVSAPEDNTDASAPEPEVDDAVSSYPPSTAGHLSTSTTSSPIQIPSDFEIDEEDVSSETESVPPSMEESAHLEKKTEFVLL